MAGLPDATRIGRVGLAVADLDRQASFYADVVGLDRLARDDGRAVLGAGEDSLVALRAAPDVPARPAGAAGLFHVAYRLPSRAALADALARVREGWRLSGASDHLVSEALYLADPEDNGIEIYRDRPREAWDRTPDGGVRMDTLPLDLDDLADARRTGAADATGGAADGDAAANGDDADDAMGAETARDDADDETDAETARDDADDAMGAETARDDATGATGGVRGATVPPGTTVGHVHLEVTDVDRSRAFYVDALGFDVMARMRDALFVSAGGYHHHVGLNAWNRRVEPAAGRGLEYFEVVVPDDGALAAAVDRLRDAGYEARRHREADRDAGGTGGATVEDPDGIEVRLTVEE